MSVLPYCHHCSFWGLLREVERPVRVEGSVHPGIRQKTGFSESPKDRWKSSPILPRWRFGLVQKQTSHPAATRGGRAGGPKKLKNLRDNILNVPTCIVYLGIV
jgi:hypothetical protein